MELGNHPPFPETLDADVDQLSQRVLQKLTPGPGLVRGARGR
jgi:hypothetical protein